jgi:hypothetical protein
LLSKDTLGMAAPGGVACRYPGIQDTLAQPIGAAPRRTYPRMVSQRKSLKGRVEEAAERALAEQSSVSPIDVCLGMGWVSAVNIENWRQGRVGSVESLLPVQDERLADLALYLRDWAQVKGLNPVDTEYLSVSRNPRPLRILSDPDLEKTWRTRWESPSITARQKEKLAAPPDLVVVIPVRDWECAECEGTGDFLIMDEASPLCLTCADMDHLEFLPSGDAALTRRSKKASRLSAIVVKWSKSRKRYERQGILAEPAAIEQAEQQCLGDADLRARRRERDAVRRADEDVVFQKTFAAEITRLFPRCPAERAHAIASHAGLRGSGRVGRSAAGRRLDEQAVTLAVVASIRHQDTDYDDLLMSGVARDVARERISADIDRVLTSFRK